MPTNEDLAVIHEPFGPRSPDFAIPAPPASADDRLWEELRENGPNWPIAPSARLLVARDRAIEEDDWEIVDIIDEELDLRRSEEDARQ